MGCIAFGRIGRAYGSLPFSVAFLYYSLVLIYLRFILTMAYTNYTTSISNFVTAMNQNFVPCPFYENIPYNPLSISRNEIRLLVIEPAANLDDRIQCRIQHVSLDYLGLPFTALSYYWGDANVGKRIILSGGFVTVTINLYRALFELRRRGLCCVWADGLCINQKDLDERSQQVLRMATIYRSASAVIACLDSLSQTAWFNSTVITNMIPRIIQFSNDNDRRPVSERKRKKPRGEQKSFLQKLIGIDTDNPGEQAQTAVVAKQTGFEFHPVERNALAEFLRNPYWFRAWIIQEVSVNAQLNIIWASEAYDFSHIVKILPFLASEVGWLKDSGARHIEQLHRIRSSQMNFKPLSLIDALGMCYQSKATIQHDRVYALLGLTFDGPSIVPSPSYLLPIDTISRNMTVRMIRATGKVDIIILKDDAVGSWYPNWFNQERWSSPLHAPRAPNETPSLLGRTHYGTYRASGSYTAELRLLYGLSISLKGFLVGSITSCSPTMWEAQVSGLPKSHLTRSRAHKGLGKEDSITQSLRWLLVEITTHDRVEVDSSRRYMGLLRRLLYWGEDSVLKYAPELIQWLNFCEVTSFMIDNKPFLSYFSESSGSYRPPSSFPRVCHMFQWNVKAGMRLGTAGGLLGWFNKNARVGDTVAILFGSSMPCILRGQLSGGYSIVGQAIVDGLMDGEFLKGNPQPVDIRLD